MPEELKKVGDGSSDKKPLEVEEPTPKKQEEDGEGEEMVQVSKKKLEVLNKDSEDLHGIFKARKLKKLAGKEDDGEGEGSPAPEGALDADQDGAGEERLSNLESGQEEIRKQNEAIFIANIDKAYEKIKVAHPWALSDNAISEIKKNLDYGSAITEDQVYAKIENAIKLTYPKEYEESLKAGIKKEVLKDANLINAGDAGGGGGSPAPLGAKDEGDSKMQATKKRLGGGLPPTFSADKT